MKRILLKCENCDKELTKRELSYGWDFVVGADTLWFCGNSCATSYSVKQMLIIRTKLIEIVAKLKESKE